MELTKERGETIGAILLNIRFQLQMINMKELRQVIADMRREEGIGPLLDPTKWRDHDLFSTFRKTTQVLELLIKLKEVLE